MHGEADGQSRQPSLRRVAIFDVRQLLRSNAVAIKFFIVLLCFAFIYYVIYFHLADAKNGRIFWQSTDNLTFQKTAVPTWHTENKTAMASNANKTSVKTILLWTSWFGDSDWKSLRGCWPLNPFVVANDNPSLKCMMTSDRSHQQTADAVIFHGRDLSFKDLPNPATRRRNVPWIFFLVEAPVNSGLARRWDVVDGIGFNWNMGFQRASDVFYPYGKLLANNETLDRNLIAKRIEDFVESFPQRQLDAVWIVSNCNAGSRRQVLVSKLKEQGISVDIWGGCGKKRPEKEQESVGYDKFFLRYRYFLSFENSMCEDYASEKLYNGFNASLHFGLIPIVYGGANYSAFLPEGTFINAEDYKNVGDLAQAMKQLKQKPDSLRRAYRWHYNYHISNLGGAYRHLNGWQTLCQRLWEQDAAKTKLTFIKNMQQRLGTCRPPPGYLVS